MRIIENMGNEYYLQGRKFWFTSKNVFTITNAITFSNN